MADREKAVRGLKLCTEYVVLNVCSICPYAYTDESPDDYDCTRALACDALEVIEGQPEIVRCRECMHGRLHHSTDVFGRELYECKRPGVEREYEELHGPEWYCADGVKKDE